MHCTKPNNTIEYNLGISSLIVVVKQLVFLLKLSFLGIKKA